MSHIIIYQPPPGSPPAAFNVGGREKIFQPPDAYWKRISGRERVIADHPTKENKKIRGTRPTLTWVLDEERNKHGGTPSAAGANRMTLSDDEYGFLERHSATRFATKYALVKSESGDLEPSERMLQGGFEFLVDLKDKEKILLNDAKREEERNAANIVAIRALAASRLKQVQEDEERKTEAATAEIRKKAEMRRAAIKDQFGLEEKELSAVEAFIKETPGSSVKKK